MPPAAEDGSPYSRLTVLRDGETLAGSGADLKVPFPSNTESPHCVAMPSLLTGKARACHPQLPCMDERYCLRCSGWPRWCRHDVMGTAALTAHLEGQTALQRTPCIHVSDLWRTLAT